MIYILARHGTAFRGKEHFSSFSLLCCLLLLLPLWISLWKSFSKLHGGLVQQRGGSFHNLLNATCGKSALFLQNYSSALESDADDIHTLFSHGQQCPPHLLHLKFIPTWLWLQLCLFGFYKLVGIISKLVFKQTNKQTREHHLVLTAAQQTSLPIYSRCADLWKPVGWAWVPFVERRFQYADVHVEIQTHEGP